MVPDWPRVAIVGGSIGGLTAGLLLRQLGCDVDVYERTPSELQARGAGIVVLKMTERYFVEKYGGLSSTVALSLPWWRWVDESGAVVAEELTDYRFGSWNSVYRGLLRDFELERYHLGHEMVDFEEVAHGVRVHFSNGTTTDCDLLVCADGVASRGREILEPHTQPSYAGYVGWRGTAREAALSDGAFSELIESIIYQILDHSHILVYPIPSVEGSLVPGERLVNFVWYRNYVEGAEFDALMTDKSGSLRSNSIPPGEVQDQFVDELHRSAREQLAPTIEEVVLKSPDPFIQVIFDMEVERMRFGRVCIIGDAASFVRPHVAAGTAKACADGWVLRDCLRDAEGDVDGALDAWEPQQLDLARTVCATSRAMGQQSQVLNTMVPGNPDWKFGLYGPGN